MTSEVKRLQEHLDALEAFMASTAYAGYVAAREQEVSDIEQRILMTPPIEEGQRSIQLMAFGELDSQKEMVKTFEDARLTLKARIDEAVERENEQAATTKV